MCMMLARIRQNLNGQSIDNKIGINVLQAFTIEE